MMEDASVGIGGGGMVGIGGGNGESGGIDAEEIKLDLLSEDERAKPFPLPAENVCLYERLLVLPGDMSGY